MDADLNLELSALAAQEALPLDLVRRLLPHPAARRAVALLRRDLTPELTEEIIRLGSARSLAANSSVPAAIRARLAEHPEPSVRAAVAAGVADEPPGLLSRLAGDRDSTVRAFLAMNEHLPAGLLAALAGDPDARVRSAVVAHRPDAPEPVRRALLTDPDPHVRRAAASAYASAAADLLPGLLADPVTRAVVVRHVEPSPALVTDPDAEVREAVAAHPALPAALREVLAGDPDAFVRAAIAARPDTPSPLRESLVAGLPDDDPLIEWVLSDHGDTHTCPAPAAAPPALTRQEAEALLARAGL
ncbi:hypothetical protein [Streptomyces sp. NPDC048606]|uniref:hypothetical protein n=1 Tax=Streptomyces sp. NPDC048606 TaxID=3154726 RepID=UPI00344A8024